MSSANWKPVKGSPPPEYTTVLFWAGGSVYLGHMDASGSYDLSLPRFRCVPVTHWAPLPKGPK